MSSAPLRVSCFSPAWGLPTTGPFALKLLAWLRLAGLDHELVHEDDPRKGPKGKSPWIEDGALRMGDTELVIEHLSRTRGVDPDAGCTAVEAAQQLAIRRMLEEHLHQVLEYELIVHDDGWSHTRVLLEAFPPVVRSLVGLWMRGHFRRQLVARGISRHAPADIARMGIADVDAIAALLGDRAFLGGDQPRTVDASAFGMLGLLAFSPLPTPTASHVRAHAKLMPYLERLRARWFPAATARAA